MLKIEEVASVCHEANRRLRTIIGETPMEPWDEAPEHIRQSIYNGVVHRLSNPNVTNAENHANWLKFKDGQGWKLGAVEDREKRFTRTLSLTSSCRPSRKSRTRCSGTS